MTHPGKRVLSELLVEADKPTFREFRRIKTDSWHIAQIGAYVAELEEQVAKRIYRIDLDEQVRLIECESCEEKQERLADLEGILDDAESESGYAAVQWDDDAEPMHFPDWLREQAREKAELEAQVAEARALFLDRTKLLNTPWEHHHAGPYTQWRERQEEWLARTAPKEQP